MTSRANYHHGDLRQAFIDAACSHLRQRSADSLSLRALARDIGVSQTAAYRHFESRNALFAAIAIQGFELLTAELQSTSNRFPDTRTALLEVGITYVDWAVANQEKYQMFFDSSLVEFSHYPELQSAGNECFEVLMTLIRRGLSEKLLWEKPSEQLAAILWAGIHGIASLLQAKHSEDQDKQYTVIKTLEFLANNRRASLELLLNSVLSH
jgi:AcrR family transcriptional regulator